MARFDSTRFRFIRHALEGSGGFRPAISYDAAGEPSPPRSTYLVRYPRESDIKFARRNEVATYENFLGPACERFAGYLAQRPPSRDLPNELYATMADDINGKGDSVDVFWQDFIMQAKARGTMLLLIDTPAGLATTLEDQRQFRFVPNWLPIAPEDLIDYQLGDDGKLDHVSFPGEYSTEEGDRIEVTWYFDRVGWEARKGDQVIDADMHPLGECPVLIFTESGGFPCYGAFSQIADLSRAHFNRTSELDEILRAQTFSLLTYHVPPEQAHQFNAGQLAEAIGTHNMLVHNGAAPAFIAPPDGPARIYLEKIAAIERRINDVALAVEAPDQQESGIALQMRFQALNAALSKFAGRIEDLERRAWELSRRWLGLSVAPDVQWRRDFTLADVATEMATLQQMQMAGLPGAAVAEQMRRIVGIQFGGMEQDALADLLDAIDERTQERGAPSADVEDGVLLP